MVARLVDAAEPVYGVSTGFGSLADTCDPAERREELQRALVRSHAAGMGPPVEREVVRAMMLLRARTLAMGRSGRARSWPRRCSPCSTPGSTPVVPEHGSLGASGDLAPLAHCALALIGEGEVATGRASGAGGRRARRRRHRAAHAARQGGPRADQRHRRDARHAGARPRTTSTRCCASPTSPPRCRSRRCSAPTARSPRTSSRCARSPARRPARPTCARCSPARRSSPATATATTAVQDAYSLRCAPQVHGAARDTLAHAERVAAAELRSAIDNPMVLPDGRVESCGNFHGAPLGLRLRLPRDRRRRGRARSPSGAPTACSTRRARTACRRSSPTDAGVNSGLMIAQYTQAAMVAENRRLAAPGQRRLAADERDAGGPRLDGLGRGAQAAHGRRQPGAHPRGRAGLRRARARPARAAAAGAGHGGGARRAARARRRARARPLARAGPRRGRGAGRVRRAARRGRGRRSERSHERASVRARAARHRALLRAAGRRRPRCGC